MDDEIDGFMDQRHFVSLDKRTEANSKDDPLENEVLPLGSDAEDASDYSMQGDDEDDNDDNGQVDTSDEDSAGSDDEDDKTGQSSWGKKRHYYYNTDYVDDEMISEEEGAAEEEEEVLLLQKQKAKERSSEDFLDTFAAKLKTSNPTAPQASLSRDDHSMLVDLQNALGLHRDEHDDVHVAKHSTGLSQQEKLEILINDAPELLKLLESFKEKITELTEKIDPLLKQVESKALPTSQGLSYLQVKFHLLLSYCINIGYYLLLKTEGKTVKDHPVIETLVRTRTLLEKLRPLDTKLKYQIDKLLKMATFQSQSSTVDDANLKHKPNLKDFERSHLSEEDELDTLGGKVSLSEKYVVPKRQAVMFEDKRSKQEREKERSKQRAKRSQIAKFFKEEYGDMPVEESFDAFKTTADPEEERLAAQEAEYEKYEEEYMTRLQRPEKRKKKKGMLGTNLPNPLAELSDFARLEGLNDLQPEAPIDEDQNFTKALRKRSFEAMADAVNKQHKLHTKNRKLTSTTKAVSDYPSDDDRDLDEHPQPKKRQRKDAEIPVEEAQYYKQVAQQLAKNKLHKQQAQEDEKRQKLHYEPPADEDGDGNDSKRKISDQIEQNKGLRKKAKKEYRNPRVKHKLKYKKALVKRKSQVQTPLDKSKPYQGEITGIKSKVVKSTKL